MEVPQRIDIPKTSRRARMSAAILEKSSETISGQWFRNWQTKPVKFPQGICLAAESQRMMASIKQMQSGSNSHEKEHIANLRTRAEESQLDEDCQNEFIKWADGVAHQEIDPQQSNSNVENPLLEKPQTRLSQDGTNDELDQQPPNRNLTDSDSSTNEGSASLPFRLANGLGKLVHWWLGLFGIIFCVSIAAVIPVLQFMALGYFLEASGRIRRRGTVWAGFVGFNQGARLASMIIGTWLFLWPVTLLGIWWEAAYLIDPASSATRNMRTLQLVGSSLILAHITTAWFCGGRLRHFFWPLIAPFAIGIWSIRRFAASRWFRPLLDGTLGRISPRFVDDLVDAKPIADWFPPAIIWSSIRKGEFFSRSRDGVWDFLQNLKLPYLLWLGFRGFVGTIAWLMIPVTLMIVSARTVDAAAVLSGLAGVLSFAMVSTFLPILQAHYAAENRLSAIFELRVARESFRRVPIRHLMTLLATYVFALPLFLLKIERIFPELLFLPAIVFITFMFPMRLIAGWTYFKACTSERRASCFFRWPAWILQIAIAILFSGFVFLTRFVIWSGASGLFDQHAFLVPAPFVEWPF